MEKSREAKLSPKCVWSRIVLRMKYSYFIADYDGGGGGGGNIKNVEQAAYGRLVCPCLGKKLDAHHWFVWAKVFIQSCIFFFLVALDSVKLIGQDHYHVTDDDSNNAQCMHHIIMTKGPMLSLKKTYSSSFFFFFTQYWHSSLQICL